MGHTQYLLEALEQAKLRRGFCAPNPAVGAVLVRDGKVIGRGTHQGAGYPHAEVEAVKNATEPVAGSTLYVTLEPCCHVGRTPPCTEWIKSHHIGEVYYGFQDPNTRVNGKGAKELSAAGIRCEHQPVEEISSFYQSYQHWRKTKRPFVTAKLALSLNGKVAHAGGKRARLSGEIAERFTHENRKVSDAILTTVNTVISDDPLLNVRLTVTPVPKTVYVLDRRLRTPTEAAIFRTTKSLYLFHEPNVPMAKREKYVARGANLVEIDVEDWEMVLEEIGSQGIHDLWVEVGGSAFQTLLVSGMMQKTHLIVAPRWLESAGLDALSNEVGPWLNRARQVTWSSLGEDALCTLSW